MLAHLPIIVFAFAAGLAFASLADDARQFFTYWRATRAALQEL